MMAFIRSVCLEHFNFTALEGDIVRAGSIRGFLGLM